MDRRGFIKLASLSGLSVAFGDELVSQAGAGEALSTPLWIFVHASGGWDPTSLCDPKGTEDLSDPARLNNYLKSQIGSAGNLRYAPLGTNEAFFQKHYSKLLIINGIDTETNSHDVGTRVTWSGSLVENSPAFAALVAANYAATEPMAFISNGGYDVTAGKVAITRVASLDVLNRLAYPNRISPDYDARTFYTDETATRMMDARNARLLALRNQQGLPRIRGAMDTLFAARTGQNELAKLTQYLPEELENGGLRRQAQVALAAYRAGICVAANLSIGGFDTHSNHDATHIPALSELLDGVDYILDEADRYDETRGNIVLVVGSDFGRTPGYNTGNGKDHWSITSMMLAGKGIKGNRVVGLTDDQHSPISINPETLAEDPNGTRVKPAHVHAALRSLAGIDNSTVVQGFPLTEATTAIPILG